MFLCFTCYSRTVRGANPPHEAFKKQSFNNIFETFPICRATVFPAFCYIYSKSNLSTSLSWRGSAWFHGPNKLQKTFLRVAVGVCSGTKVLTGITSLCATQDSNTTGSCASIVSENKMLASPKLALEMQQVETIWKVYNVYNMPTLKTGPSLKMVENAVQCQNCYNREF